MNILRREETSTIIIMLRDDGLIKTQAQPDWVGLHELHHAQEIMEIMRDIEGTEMKYPVLNIVSTNKVSMEAREYYSSHPPITPATAMVTPSFVSKIVGNFFINFHKMQVPTRIFTQEDEAIDWLKSYIPE